MESGTFRIPIIKRSRPLKAITKEHNLVLPQVHYIAVKQVRPTFEGPVSIPQIHFLEIRQIIPTYEKAVEIPQVRFININVWGEFFIEQEQTVVDKIAIKQEWELYESCIPTKTHFLKLPVRDIGIAGTVIRNISKSTIPQCPKCEKECPVVNCPPCASRSGAPAVKYVEKCDEPTEIHYINFNNDCMGDDLGMPALHAAKESFSKHNTGSPWWLIPLIILGLLLLCLIMAILLLCVKRKAKPAAPAPKPIQQVKAAPRQSEKRPSP